MSDPPGRDEAVVREGPEIAKKGAYLGSSNENERERVCETRAAHAREVGVLKRHGVGNVESGAKFSSFFAVQVAAMGN
jgi:hypothetical protein